MIRRFVFKWFARFVIFAPPSALLVFWLYGNYRLWFARRPLPDWVDFVVLFLDAIVIVGGIVFVLINAPSIMGWLWDHAELRGRRDPRL